MRFLWLAVPAAVAVAASGLASPPIAAQDTVVPALNARASDPVTMGWMVGAPPPQDKLVRFSDNSWFRFPQSRWSFSNIRQLMPTRVVRRGDGAVKTLPKALRTDLDAVTFQPIGRTDSMTWAQSLEANYTDGILVLHRGRIVYERYFGVLTADWQHLAFSVTKSFVASVAATLIADGTLDEKATVASYVPELRDAGVGDATLRQLLDMTTGLDYTEDYADSKSPLWELIRAGGFLARPQDYRGPESFFDYLKTVKKAKPHGETFAYKTVNTDALGAVLSRVTGMSVSELLRARIFSKLGAEHDAFFTADSTGAEFAGGGLNLTLRDLARFGELMRLQGRYNGQQIVPTAVVDDIRRGATVHSSRSRATRLCRGGATGTCGGSRTTHTARSQPVAFTGRGSTSTPWPKWLLCGLHRIHSPPMRTTMPRHCRRTTRSLDT